MFAEFGVTRPTSSPHTRGSSVNDLWRDVDAAVVPAHAGVFLRQGCATERLSRRPRTRGGLPPPWIEWLMGFPSSPHTRGSSRSRRSASALFPVVPAHAGVFRRNRRHRVGCGRRPRTRGGLPVIEPLQDRGLLSSPHTRGSSRAHRVALACLAVVPAHAGVFPPRWRSAPPGCCRPRTRGGLPCGPMRPVAGTGSSPHTRGSSCHSRRCWCSDLVVPAHAGVFPTSWPTPPRAASRPRTRGGLPASFPPHVRCSTSSPHTRGSSVGRDVIVGVRDVVPAHAGVFPRRSGPGLLCPRRPRTRGGLPSLLVSSGAGLASSPHTRGSSSSSTVQHPARAVVPAHAGVFPRSWPVTRRPWRRPRTRGGLPVAVEVLVDGTPSSPHTRGSSRRGAGRVPAHPVVPAHAGVFPRVLTRASQRLGRPRTRGGLPRGGGHGAHRSESSPHTRGSSGGMRGGRGWWGVVPAHAGVFRGWSRRGRRLRRRPRTRGGLPLHVQAPVRVGPSSPHTRGSSP